MNSKVIALLIILFAIFGYAGESTAQPARLPAGPYLDMGGKTYTSDNLKGKLVIVDFWATWCVACRASIPVLNELWQQYAAQGLVVLAISNDEDPALVRKFTDRQKMTYPIVHDPADKFSALYQVSNLPTLFVFGADGKLLHRGNKMDAEEKEKIQTLVRQSLAK